MRPSHPPDCARETIDPFGLHEGASMSSEIVSAPTAAARSRRVQSAGRRRRAYQAVLNVSPAKPIWNSPSRSGELAGRRELDHALADREEGFLRARGVRVRVGGHSSPRPARLRISAAGAETPFRAFRGEPDRIAERAELRLADRDHVAGLAWVKPCPGASAVLGRREQRTEEQHEPVRILVMPPDRLRGDVRPGAG